MQPNVQPNFLGGGVVNESQPNTNRICEIYMVQSLLTEKIVLI